MKMKKISAFVLVALIIAPCFSQAAENPENKIKKIYNRYSYFLDKKYNKEFQTWFFAAPSYEIPEWTLASEPRHLISLATFYKYRAQDGEPKALEKIRRAIRKSVYIQCSDPDKMNSFHSAITNFLIVRMIEQIPEVLPKNEIEKYENSLVFYLPFALEADDTENRAALAGVYWLYVKKYLTEKGFEFNPKIDKKIKEKIDKSFNESLSPDFLYRENRKSDFSLHYHALEAFLLQIYGDCTKQVKYVIYAREMTENLYNLSFKNGLLETKFGARPSGANAQTYLMAALLAKRFKYADYQTYLHHLTTNRFFSDQRFKNRLEWHATFEGSQVVYHDDYSFANIAELTIIQKNWQDVQFPLEYAPLQNTNITNSETFFIKNNGDKIIFIDKINKLIKKIRLSSYGLSTKPF